MCAGFGPGLAQERWLCVVVKTVHWSRTRSDAVVVCGQGSALTGTERGVSLVGADLGAAGLPCWAKDGMCVCVCGQRASDDSW